MATYYTNRQSSAATLTSATITNLSVTNVNATNISASGTLGVTGLSTLTAGITGNIILANIQSGITANADANQANATALTGALCLVSTCAANGNGVKLPATPTAGQIIEVVNDGATDVGVFPGTGDTIDSLSANTRYYLAAGSRQRFLATSDSAWKTLNRSLRFVDMGDLAASHFSQTDLTMDNAFHDLSLASIIPPSVYSNGRIHPVHIRVTIADNTVGALLRVRTKGFSNLPHGILAVGIVASNTTATSNDIVPNSSGVVEYLASETLTAASISVFGYWVET